MVKIVEKAHNPLFYAALQDVINPREASQKYRYGIRTIRRWCDEGRFACIKVDKRWRISETSLILFLQYTGRLQEGIEATIRIELTPEFLA